MPHRFFPSPPAQLLRRLACGAASAEAEVPKLLAEGEAQMKDRQYGETPARQSALKLMRAVIVFSSEKRQFAAWTLAPGES